jgi:hypothetical protein
VLVAFVTHAKLRGFPPAMTEVARVTRYSMAGVRAAVGRLHARGLVLVYDTRVYVQPLGRATVEELCTV